MYMISQKNRYLSRGHEVISLSHLQTNQLSLHLLIVIVSSKIPPNHSVNYARCLAWHMVHLLTKVDSLLIRTQLMSPCTRTHLLDGWLSKLLPRDINHPGESLFDSEKTVRVIIYQADHQQQCEICFTLGTENDIILSAKVFMTDKHLKGQLWPRVSNIFPLFLPCPPPLSQRSVVALRK